MAVKFHNAALKYNSPESGKQQYHTLIANQSFTIGRDPACQIALDPAQYKGVSRRHAELTPIAAGDGQVQWQIRDLGSSNGVFINGHRLQNAQVLQNGDRVSLGRNGIDLIFESQSNQRAKASNSLPAATECDYSRAVPASTSASPPSKVKSNYGKIIGGVVAVAAIFLLLNSPQTSQPVSETTPPPASQPASPQPTPQAPSDSTQIDFQGSELIAQYFNVLEEKVLEDIPVKSSNGSEVKVDLYGFVVEAKSRFSNTDVIFTAHFYDASGTEINEPVQIHYDPPHSLWEPGTKAVAGFVLPNDRANLTVIRFSR